MNIYIDLGCYDGDSVEQFRNWSKVAFKTKAEWWIYAFDINPKFKKDWDKNTDAFTRFELKAAWIEDGEIDVAIDQSDTPLGSTAMPGKVNIWDKYPKTKVKSFDFSEYLKQFKDDYVVVKMDIEGSEFPVLEKMIKDETDMIVDLLLVEMHPNKVQEYTTTYSNDLLDKLRSRGMRVELWH